MEHHQTDPPSASGSVTQVASASILRSTAGTDPPSSSATALPPSQMLQQRMHALLTGGYQPPHAVSAANRPDLDDLAQALTPNARKRTWTRMEQVRTEERRVRRRPSSASQQVVQTEEEAADKQAQLAKAKMERKARETAEFLDAIEQVRDAQIENQRAERDARRENFLNDLFPSPDRVLHLEDRKTAQVIDWKTGASRILESGDPWEIELQLIRQTERLNDRLTWAVKILDVDSQPDYSLSLQDAPFDALVDLCRLVDSPYLARPEVYGLLESTAEPIKEKAFMLCRLPDLLLVDHLSDVLLAELDLINKGQQHSFLMDREVEKLVAGLVAVLRDITNAGLSYSKLDPSHLRVLRSADGSKVSIELSPHALSGPINPSATFPVSLGAGVEIDLALLIYGLVKPFYEPQGRQGNVEAAAHTHASNAVKALLDRLSVDWKPLNPSARTPGVWSSPPPSSPSIPGTDIRHLFSTSSRVSMTPTTSPSRPLAPPTRDQESPAPTSPLAAAGAPRAPSFLTAVFTQTEALRRKQQAEQQEKERVEQDRVEQERAEQERAEQERAEQEQAEKEQAEKEPTDLLKTLAIAAVDAQEDAMDLDEPQQQPPNTAEASNIAELDQMGVNEPTTEPLPEPLVAVVDPTQAGTEPGPCPRSPAAGASASSSLPPASSSASPIDTSTSALAASSVSAGLTQPAAVTNLNKDGAAESTSPATKASTKTAAQGRPGPIPDSDSDLSYVRSSDDESVPRLGGRNTIDPFARARTTSLHPSPLPTLSSFITRSPRVTSAASSRADPSSPRPSPRPGTSSFIPRQPRVAPAASSRSATRADQTPTPVHGTPSPRASAAEVGPHAPSPELIELTEGERWSVDYLGSLFNDLEEGVGSIPQLFDRLLTNWHFKSLRTEVQLGVLVDAINNLVVLGLYLLDSAEFLRKQKRKLSLAAARRDKRRRRAGDDSDESDDQEGEEEEEDEDNDDQYPSDDSNYDSNGSDAFDAPMKADPTMRLIPQSPSPRQSKAHRSSPPPSSSPRRSETPARASAATEDQEDGVPPIPDLPDDPNFQYPDYDQDLEEVNGPFVNDNFGGELEHGGEEFGGDDDLEDDAPARASPSPARRAAVAPHTLAASSSPRSSSPSSDDDQAAFADALEETVVEGPHGLTLRLSSPAGPSAHWGPGFFCMTATEHQLIEEQLRSSPITTVADWERIAIVAVQTCGGSKTKIKFECRACGWTGKTVRAPRGQGMSERATVMHMEKNFLSVEISCPPRMTGAMLVPKGGKGTAW